MSTNECSICKVIYNKNNNKPMMLECGDTLCSSCIKHYKESFQKDEFKCEQCCNITKATKIENKSAYPKENVSNESTMHPSPPQGEFEVFIKLLSGEKLSVKVNKEMTVDQLKSIIAREKGMNKGGLFLTFKKPRY